MCGTPVIAFPKGSVNEIIEYGITGFIVNSLEEAVNLIKSDKLKDLIEKGVPREQEIAFSHDRFISEHEQYYEEVVKQYVPTKKKSLFFNLIFFSLVGTGYFSAGRWLEQSGLILVCL